MTQSENNTTATSQTPARASGARVCACGEPGSFGRGMCARCYNRVRYRAQVRGTWRTDRTDAVRVREHVARLREAGLRDYQIARLAGVEHSTLSRLPEVEQVRRGTEAKLLAVPVPEHAAAVAPDSANVSAVGSIRRIQALVAFGYPQTELAAALGIELPNLRALTGRAPGGKNTGEQVTAARHRQIAELFDRWQMRPQALSQQAREFGKQMRWALPFEWDEDALDDPHAAPVRSRWTQASAAAEHREQSAQRRAWVAELTAQGLSTTEIAMRLGVTARTVTRDRSSGRDASNPVLCLPDSDIDALADVARQARRDIAARRRPSRERQRTR